MKLILFRYLGACVNFLKGLKLRNTKKTCHVHVVRTILHIHNWVPINFAASYLLPYKYLPPAEISINIKKGTKGLNSPLNPWMGWMSEWVFFLILFTYDSVAHASTVYIAHT